jgi:hypothetical protein
VTDRCQIDRAVIGPPVSKLGFFGLIAEQHTVSQKFGVQLHRVGSIRGPKPSIFGLDSASPCKTNWIIVGIWSGRWNRTHVRSLGGLWQNQGWIQRHTSTCPFQKQESNPPKTPVAPYGEVAVTLAGHPGREGPCTRPVVGQSDFSGFGPGRYRTESHALFTWQVSAAIIALSYP